MSHHIPTPRGSLLRGTAALAATLCTAVLFSGASIGFRSAPFAFEGDTWTHFGEGIRISERHAGTVFGGLETPLSVVLGDVDGDGIVDLVAGYGSAEGGVVDVHKGLGSEAPHFRSRAVRTVVSHRPEHLVVGDFDGDGRPRRWWR